MDKGFASRQRIFNSINVLHYLSTLTTVPFTGYLIPLPNNHALWKW